MATYFKSDVDALKKALQVIRELPLSSSETEFTRVYEENFEKLEIVLPMLIAEIDTRVKLFRVIEVKDELGTSISNFSYNPKFDCVPGRCHLRNEHVFYGSNHIVGAIFEVLFKSVIEYKINYTNYIGKKFVIGEWELNPKNLHRINFLYDYYPEGIKSDMIDYYTIGTNQFFEDRGVDQIFLIKELLNHYRTMFFDDHKITGNLGSKLFNKYKYKGSNIEVIQFPSVIDGLQITNFAIPKRNADCINILKPIKFNYCMLEEVPHNGVSQGILKRRVLQVGIGDNFGSIKWSSNRDDIQNLEIKDNLDKAYYDPITKKYKLLRA